MLKPRLIYNPGVFGKLIFGLVQALYFCILILLIALAVFGTVILFRHFISVETCPMGSKYYTHPYWNFKELLVCFACPIALPFMAKALYKVIGDAFSSNKEVRGRIEELEIRQELGRQRHHNVYYVILKGKGYKIRKSWYEQLQKGELIRIKLTKYQEEVRGIYTEPG
jgi:hypothetical protein